MVADGVAVEVGGGLHAHLVAEGMEPGLPLDAEIIRGHPVVVKFGDVVEAAEQVGFQPTGHGVLALEQRGDGLAFKGVGLHMDHGALAFAGVVQHPFLHAALVLFAVKYLQLLFGKLAQTLTLGGRNHGLSSFPVPPRRAKIDGLADLVSLL